MFGSISWRPRAAQCQSPLKVIAMTTKVQAQRMAAVRRFSEIATGQLLADDARRVGDEGNAEEEGQLE